MAYLSGTSLANRLVGTAGADTLLGRGGNDILEGGGGNDRINGGRGNDTLSGGAGQDTFQFALGDGQDIVTDFTAGDLIRISGYTSAQSLVQTGTQVVLTLSATDKIVFSNATLASVQAALNISSGAGTGGGSAGGTITGTSGKDKLSGGAANETIYGLGGDDTIDGGGGNDRIYGGAGWDVMTGGAGYDVFVFTSASESPMITTIFSDFITDWSAGDRIDLSGIDANAMVAGNQAFSFGGYSFGQPPSVTTPGTFSICGFGGSLSIVGFTDNVPGIDVYIEIWSVLGEAGLTSSQIFF